MALTSHIVLAAIASGILAHFASGQGEPPSPEPIRLGMSTALTGPAAQLGLNMRAGVVAALDEANRAGGVGGVTLELIALDDGYEPSRTAPNMRALIEEKNVLAVIGNVGTPTAVAAIPIANEGKTPFFGAFTGAGVLRKEPPERYVVNYRASYKEETAAMVEALIEKAGLRPQEIAFFTQRDAYGDAGFAGGIAALMKRGLASDLDVAHGRYERNTVAVEDGLAEVLAAGTEARAVIMVGAYAPCAEFIRLGRELGLDAIYLNVSFVGAAPLASALGESGNGVIITQVVPHYDSKVPIVGEYLAALDAHDPEAKPTFGSLEGYVATRIFLRALRTIEDAPSRESVIDALEGLGRFDLGLGVPLELGPSDHQASPGRAVWPTVIRDGGVVPFSWSELGSGDD